MKITLIITVSLFFNLVAVAQNYPTFSNEKQVTITGLNFDAMEPFISANGNTLFFNSLNNGVNTNLYYATKINDTTFNYVGLITGTLDSASNHLDAVASIDSLSNFFWTSLRGYPSVFENLHKGKYTNGNVKNITRVYGNFNISKLGWLIIDAAISIQGNQLYYCNAYFDLINNSCGSGVPCEGMLGVAEQINDSMFNKTSNSDTLLNAINDTNYVVYAPQLSADGLELYYTRFHKNTITTEICVAVRNNSTSPFSVPSIIYAPVFTAAEAPTITLNKQKLYYHHKNNFNSYKIYMRYRNNITITNSLDATKITFFPNPATNKIWLNIPLNTNCNIKIYSILGTKVMEVNEVNSFDISTLTDGMYYVTLEYENRSSNFKFIKQ